MSVMADSMHHSVDQTEALTPVAQRALDLFGHAARAAYGDGLVQLVLFGSRSRGEARSDSDIDVAVVLRNLPDRRADRDRLADLAYDAIVETSLDIQTVPVSLDEWEHPEHHTNPALIRAIKRDGVVVEADHDPRPAEQSIPFS
ncbi:nucleotidyltransferase domain-containing protein [Bradyrhizobium brasilense]|uniref:nucleotidyltransferase domain-containing protein n=1 Tax=Bradyrhizobium brasilense TaxID=1419277 RepID=UPI001E3FD8F0|nr:nucleotidyltransferase domain-containing protein [Bradyrhizobium brasilense]